MNVEGQAAMMIQETVHDAMQGIHPDTLHFRVDRNPHIVGVVITGSTPYHQGALIIAAHHVAALGHIAIHGLSLLIMTDTTTDWLKSLSLHTKIEYSSGCCCLTMMATILNFSLVILLLSKKFTGIYIYIRVCVLFCFLCLVLLLMLTVGS
jgi:hypothetical protein